MMKSLLSLFLFLLSFTPLLAQGPTLFGRHQIDFQAEPKTDPNIEFTVQFTAPSGKTFSVDGFWDGGTDWRVRFMPTEYGKWTYRTASKPEVTGLHQKMGTFQVAMPKGDEDFWASHGPIQVSKSGTHLQYAKGQPFFWLGDTVWTGPAFSTMPDWEKYLAERGKNKYSVIQFNLISPWRTAPTDAEGLIAYEGKENIRVNPQFFKRVDQHMDAINQHGLVAAPVLLWALTKHDAGIQLSEADAIRLIRYEVARYGAHHVVWILAGDNPYNKESAERWKRIGRAVFGNRPHAPVTTHPTGMNWPWESWRKEEWLDILGYQSGHGDHGPTLQWIHSGPVAMNRAKTPVKPIINLEPPYEDHLGYQSRKPHSAYNVRRAVYWSLLAAPVAGVTYGGHGLWSWEKEGGKPPPDHAGTGIAKKWDEALKLPGGLQMNYVVQLIESLPWTELRPSPELLKEPLGKENPAKFISVASTSKKDSIVAYLPIGGTIQFQDVIQFTKGEWFDPRTGKRQPASSKEFRFEAPSSDDWVLILKSPVKN